MGAKLEGRVNLDRALKNMPDNVREAAGETLRTWAKDVRATARDLVPVDSGRLRKSIRYRVNKKALSAVVRTDVYYAQFIEFGTSSMEAQPFLQPAFEAERGDVERELRSTVVERTT